MKWGGKGREEGDGFGKTWRNKDEYDKNIW